MKKRFLSAALMCAVIFTACSSGESGTNGAYASEMFSYDGGDGNYQYAPSAFSKSAYSDSYSEENGALIEINSASDSGEDSSSSGEIGLAAENLQKEMLVYYCTMEIDTLDFDSSLNSFRNTLDMYGGFIEDENYSDGGSGGRWYYENNEKWQTYTATLRVPSKNYDAFCNSAGELGDLRSKNARVENVSQEYSDLATTLEIYEAKEERYISLLADITEDEYAVAIEKELTDIQIRIANIRTRMNAIRTDVAYSYVYITLHEVKEYTSEPVKTDTFSDRLVNTLKNAGRGFLNFLEGLLFVLIYLAPYLVLIGIVAFIVILIAKKCRKHRAKKREKSSVQPEIQLSGQVSEESVNKDDKK